MTAKWNGSAWTIAPHPTIPMVGAATEEPEEAEEPVETEEKVLDTGTDSRVHTVLVSTNALRSGELARLTGV